MDPSQAFFIGAVVTLLMDWTYQTAMSWWLGPKKTTELVVARFQDRKTATVVREALDLPTRAELTGVMDKVNQLDTIFSVKMAEIMGKVDSLEAPDMAPLEAKLEELGNKSIEFPEETVQAIAADISSQVQAAVSGHVGAAVKGERAEAKKIAREVQEEYFNSPEWEKDQAGNIELVAKYMPNGSRGAAKFIVKRGPAFVDAWAHHTLGREYNTFKGLWDALQDDGPGAGAVAVHGGGWLTR